MPMPGKNRWSPTDVARFKPFVFLLGLYPLVRWTTLALAGNLGANPQEFLIRSSGLWALVALLLTLTVTPLRRIMGQPALVGIRRMLGLFSFFYAVVHTAGWAVWERDRSLTAMAQDVIDRPFIAIGLFATILLLALALTSTRGWMRRLGRRWQQLHRTIHVAAGLSIWHFWLVRAGKNDFSAIYVYAGILIALWIARPLTHYTSRQTR